MINLNQSNDTEQDRVYLERIIGDIKKISGERQRTTGNTDRNKVTRLDIPDIKIDYCNNLMKELDPILIY